MGDNFDDMADLNAFQDPAVVKASKHKNPVNYDPGYSGAQVGGYNQPSYSGGDIGGSRGFSDDYDARAAKLEREKIELEQRKLELDRREAEYAKNVRSAYKVPNFPPIPGFLPFQPCFYINIEEEVPAHYYQLCRHLLYRYYAYCIMLLINVFMMLFGLISSLPQATVGLIMSIVAFICIVPTSFIFVFRSAYQSLKSKSSFYFILFFISIFCEILFHFFQFLGITGNTWAGFINGATLVDAKHQFVGALFIIFGFGWATMFGITVYLGKLMYDAYRAAGANIQDAQTEFASKVFYQSTQSAYGGAYATNLPPP